MIVDHHYYLNWQVTLTLTLTLAPTQTLTNKVSAVPPRGGVAGYTQDPAKAAAEAAAASLVDMVEVELVQLHDYPYP